MKELKLYTAGPEVFLQNAAENAEKQRQICKKYGFVALHPMDNNTDFGNRDLETAMRIYLGDVGQVRDADIIVANCNPFRGTCIDDGTAYELGFRNALGKISYGYLSKIIGEVERVVRGLMLKRRNAENVPIDHDGYLVVDDFGTSINLMMQCGMMHSRGRLIEGDSKRARPRSAAISTPADLYCNA